MSNHSWHTATHPAEYGIRLARSCAPITDTQAIEAARILASAQQEEAAA